MKTKSVFVIELPNAPAPCWVAVWAEGDPPRTHDLSHAKRFHTRKAAERGLERAKATMYRPDAREMRVMELVEV